VQCGLPVIVTRNAWTMPQERWNTEWVREHGLGRVERSFAQVDEAVAALLADLPAYRARVAAVPNHAVFEVPRVLQRILDGATLPATGGAAAGRRAPVPLELV
jgi:1,2-diacylglycerol 3-beta-galactosyltransferase